MAYMCILTYVRIRWTRCSGSSLACVASGCDSAGDVNKEWTGAVRGMPSAACVLDMRKVDSGTLTVQTEAALRRSWQHRRQAHTYKDVGHDLAQASVCLCARPGCTGARSPQPEIGPAAPAPHDPRPASCCTRPPTAAIHPGHITPYYDTAASSEKYKPQSPDCIITPPLLLLT